MKGDCGWPHVCRPKRRSAALQSWVEQAFQTAGKVFAGPGAKCESPELRDRRSQARGEQVGVAAVGLRRAQGSTVGSLVDRSGFLPWLCSRDRASSVQVPCPVFRSGDAIIDPGLYEHPLSVLMSASTADIVEQVRVRASRKGVE